MTTLTVELPEALRAEIGAAVQAGWFSNESEAVRAAVYEFLAQGRLAQMERQQLADIEWAVEAGGKRP